MRVELSDGERYTVHTARWNLESHDSWALRLADGFQCDAKPGDDEILADVAQAKTQDDLEVRFWNDYADLYEQMYAAMAQHLGIGAEEYAAFNSS